MVEGESSLFPIAYILNIYEFFSFLLGRSRFGRSRNDLLNFYWTPIPIGSFFKTDVKEIADLLKRSIFHVIRL